MVPDAHYTRLAGHGGIIVPTYEGEPLYIVYLSVFRELRGVSVRARTHTAS